jgi:hypothetical protein
MVTKISPTPLLVVAWVVNFVTWFGIVMHVHDRELHATANAGSRGRTSGWRGCGALPQSRSARRRKSIEKGRPFSLRFVFARCEQDSRYEPIGKLQIVIGDESNLGVGSMYVLFPSPLAVTLLGFAAIVAFLRFRFPLWSYFAWTALVAAELAYYLR